MLAITFNPSTATTDAATKPDPVEPRRQRGIAIAGLSRIEKKHQGFWTVPSQSGAGKYWVRPDGDGMSCTCKDYEKRSQPCKHIFAVQHIIEREIHGDGSETVTETTTVTESITKVTKTTAERKTYRQDWPAYNKAQTTEKHRFQTILSDLCRGIPNAPRDPSKRGPKPTPLSDIVFAAAFKVYSLFSGRRFQTDLDQAFGDGHLSRSVRYNTIFDYLDNVAIAPILVRLIIKSSLPLRSLENDFAVDSSGFTSCRYVKWWDHKYGVPRQEHDWVKVSVMTGVHTNVITAVQIDEKHAGDCPQFPVLVRKTAENFRINEVSADAAYLSYENMDVVDECGGTPFILFKANTTAEQGGLLAKMFHLYNLNRDDYLEHYHKRSNVESTFSMVKAKFGSHLSSKTPAAMINEALCKILCHNICCLIQSHYELGVVAEFWGEEPEAEAPAQIEATPEVGSDEFIDAMAWI